MSTTLNGNSVTITQVSNGFVIEGRWNTRSRTIICTNLAAVITTLWRWATPDIRVGAECPWKNTSEEVDDGGDDAIAGSVVVATDLPDGGSVVHEDIAAIIRLAHDEVRAIIEHKLEGSLGTPTLQALEASITRTVLGACKRCGNRIEVPLEGSQ